MGTLRAFQGVPDCPAVAWHGNLRTFKGIPDCPEPRVNYLGLRAISVPAADVAHRNFQIPRSSSRMFHAEAAFNPMSYRDRCFWL